jgi:hypothetical protein
VEELPYGADEDERISTTVVGIDIPDTELVATYDVEEELLYGALTDDTKSALVLSPVPDA